MTIICLSNHSNTVVGFFFRQNASNSKQKDWRDYNMATVIRAKISERNKYWIDKHRHYELKHFCLQYPMWKRTYAALADLSVTLSNMDRTNSNKPVSDPTASCALKRAYYSEKIKMVETVALETDSFLYQYILKAVTEGLSYTYLRTKMNIPCGRDMYYERYRKFFWLLSKTRE